MKRLVVALTAASLLAGCGMLGGRERGPTTPTVGERIPVLGREGQVEADPSLADVPVTVPMAVANTDWPQPGGNAAHVMIHVALPDTISQAWSVSIGDGSSNRARLAAEPVVAEGRVYTIDTRAMVRAFSADTGAQIWERQVRGENSPRETLFGGGVAFDNGRVYVTNGAGDAAALNAATGEVAWIKKPGGPLRGAPSIGADAIYVISQDNQLYALNPENGDTRWTGSGSFELAGVFGTAAPAVAQSTVVAGFSSGELTAYRYENGQVVWQDALSRTGVSTTVGTLSDVDADPVIDNGRVFAVGQGGRMVAVELITGQRAWELNIAGLSTPWVAGEWVFVVTDRAQLLAVARSSGRIRWIAQLPAFRRPERRSDPDRRTGEVRVRPGQDQIFWRGPILAGNRLLLVNSLGQMVNVSPTDGSVISTTEMQPQSGLGAFFSTGGPRTLISLPPVVANNTLYILDDTGRLTAWR
ncbi:PQQ-binding-like beta-propeller repeat protein [Sphingosinicella sp. LHD-64]|uniref:outer membrane protein assembly factor BamB family protein n=1 Tax=Sphingosinicella sp. LHD-64 TaxID=3072139 RepID=UPI002810454F|nr:PQQ-binding-like beta-propeller repeat protein [Sphingosinicella sp. LHD-64]MDQ8755708.1 PQQ-binding-like beta-propeller repeat protein [Sphingosinicella sp. LHD-64]